MHRSIRTTLRALHAVALGLVSAVLFLWPGIELTRALFDPALAGPQPATQAWHWHRALTPAFEQWAVARRERAAAGALSLDNISGTEWPLFGAVFYLRASENLDRAWLLQPRGERPAVHARGAIDAAAALLADPAQATWVQQHWGASDYLHRENVFYRMLLIDGLATQARLTGASAHLALLRSQVDALSAELSMAPTGLLADYPGQTFPADVAAAWHAILRADAVLGTDHGVAASAAVRGFVGTMAPELGLPPYAWFGTRDPEPTEVRGCANAWLLHHAPFLWPEQARQWFDQHTQHYWQETAWLAGYREFERTASDAFYSDVDSGPVIAGLGTSATAFGLGAARSVGAFREARALALEAVALGWPLPNGRLLGPRLMSDLTDAPLLGEAAMLYNLTQPPAPGFGSETVPAAWRDVPGIVWCVLCVQLLLGSAGLWRSVLRLRRLLQA